jgi:hypothetical protein
MAGDEEIGSGRYHHAVGERAPRWRRAGRPLWLLVPIALMALAVPFIFSEAVDHQAYSPGQGMAAPVSYQGRRWEASGRVIAVPDRQLAKVGMSRDGRALYVLQDANRPAGGGGGGGTTAGDVLPGSLLYVRVGQDAYQPLIPR